MCSGTVVTIRMNPGALKHSPGSTRTDSSSSSFSAKRTSVGQLAKATRSTCTSTYIAPCGSDAVDSPFIFDILLTEETAARLMVSIIFISHVLSLAVSIVGTAA